MNNLIAALVFACSLLLSACASSPKLESLTQCNNPRPQVCTMEYNPVCGLREDQSIGDYATGCTACSDDNVTGWAPGTCPEDVTNTRHD